MIKIKGLEEASRNLKQLQDAIKELNEPVVIPEFDSNDVVSVHLAIAKVIDQIDLRMLPYRRNKAIVDISEKLKFQYQQNILTLAGKDRLIKNSISMNSTPLMDALKRIENAVQDMQLIDHQSEAAHFELLSHLLHSEELDEVTRQLLSGIDFDEWKAVGEATQGGMVGSASLKWPVKLEERVGLVISLIDRVAGGKLNLFGFAYTFYHSSSSTACYRKLVSQMINPFARDYKDYVIKKMGVNAMSKNGESSATVGHQVNFYNSNVGAFQTGDKSVANVNMQNNSTASPELLAALDAVAKALSEIAVIPGHDKGEILELVEESKQEIGKEKPNGSKMKTYLSAIGGALGAVANLRPAYEMLAAAASLAGYSLPSIP